MNRIGNKTIFFVITFLISICIIVIVSCRHDRFNRNNTLQIDPSENANNCTEITPTELIYLDSLNLDNFTATGFTYDSATDSFWIGDRGTNPNDEIKLIQVSSDFSTVISSCQIGDYVNDGVNNLQGIAYNPQSDNILCAMGEKILEVDKRGG